jgi:hypothetical protein
MGKDNQEQNWAPQPNGELPILFSFPERVWSCEEWVGDMQNCENFSLKP